jgi:CDP-glycerol glycerophosphotransferase
VLDRPIVVFAPDWEEYQRIRGVYFDLRADPPGLFTTTQEELQRALLDGSAAGPEAAKQRAAFRARFCPWDDGQAADRVVRAVFPVG